MFCYIGDIILSSGFGMLASLLGVDELAITPCFWGYLMKVGNCCVL